MALLGNLTGSSQFFNDPDFYNEIATQSLRFDSGSSNYLEWTPSTSSTSTRTFTVSTWVKLGNLKTGSDSFIWCGQNVSNTTNCDLNFKTNNGEYYFQIGANGQSVKNTSQLRRDVSAWYHLVAVFDTTQGTDTNRIKLYVNGEQITISGTFPSQNTDFDIGGSNKQMIGALNLGSAGRFFEGYMAEFNFVDGTALDASYFGETKNGVWIAKKYTGSYGTNGFRLQFNQTGVGTASTSTIGADTSGNTNHFTSSGIVASDCDMPDSPENGFANINPLNVTDSTSPTFSEGNLKTVVSNDGSKWGGSSTIGASSGKYYFEVLATQSSNVHIGVADETAVREGARIDDHNVTTGGNAVYYRSNEGNKRVITNGSQVTSSYASTYTTTDIIGVAFDVDGSEVTFFKNNSSLGAITIPTTTENLFIALSGGTGNAQNTFHLNAGADSSFAGNKTAQGNTDAKGIGDFYYAPPSGFLALCTSNLPEPTISPNALTQADDYFNTVLYSGSGSAQTINIGFSTDFTWIKNRGTTNSHLLADSTRGSTKVLLSNDTNAEITDSDYTTFVSNGFSVSGNGNEINNSSGTYVSWNWKANGGTTSSNTDGSITSTVQANTTAGFSIVTWTGNATLPTTIGHGLGKQPLVLIVKNRDDDSTSWFVHHHKTTLGSTAKDYLNLDTTSADANSNDIWGQTRPTTSVFTVGVNNQVNGNGDAMIAYCFAEIEGYSKFGSYTGNGNADGTFVYTGFRPAFIITKLSSHASSWSIVDTKRDPFNIVNQYLLAESSGAEGDFDSFDILSNGFKARTTNAERNGSGRTVIYMAFAEAPFKYANAR